jgi:hypothetical protein
MTGADYPDMEPDLIECWSCHGDGVVYSCFEEYACVDPESGCDQCERRCDVCHKKGGSAPSPFSDEDTL